MFIRAIKKSINAVSSLVKVSIVPLSSLLFIGLSYADGDPFEGIKAPMITMLGSGSIIQWVMQAFAAIAGGVGGIMSKNWHVAVGSFVTLEIFILFINLVVFK